MSNATDKVMDGSVWRDFCRALEAAGDVVLKADAAANPLDRAEGFRYLTRLLRIALEMNLEWADPEDRSGRQNLRLVSQQSHATDKHTARTAQVGQRRARRAQAQLGVLARDQRVRQRQIVVWGSPDHKQRVDQRNRLDNLPFNSNH